ncbi:uncharacterized protein LOC129355214 [Poeciliopsis prolifica]|uniref:uncharacterized protein LOC129355214 n=1 Tax=Poeciliopsis prolifica TaxID=188132 RepID=UPI002413F5A7|nr:uncharacterized protein LOC129355214 [Poeciliopsis prolifica]
MPFPLKNIIKATFLQYICPKKTPSKIAVNNEHGSSHEKWSLIQRKGPLWKEDQMKMEENPPSTQRNLPMTRNFYPVETNKCGPLYIRFIGVHWRNLFWNMLGTHYSTACQHRISAVKNLSSPLSSQLAFLDKSRLHEVQNRGFWVLSEPRQSVSRDEFQNLSLDPGSADQRPESPVSSLLTMKSNKSKKEPLWFRNESDLSKLCQSRKMDVSVEEVKNRNILVLQWLFGNHQYNDEDQEVTKEPGPPQPESYLIGSACSSPASLSDDSGYSEILSCPENHLLSSGMTEVWVMTVCVDDNKDRPASPFSSCLSEISDWSTD